VSQGSVLGLIGGLGVGATVHYYQAIVDALRRRGQAAQMLIAHADVERVLADVREGDLSALAGYLAGLFDRLAAAGATFGTVPAVTPHICFPELARRSRLPLVSIVAETARAIASRDLRRVGLFGTRFVIESDLYGQLTDVAVVRPRPEEIDLIHDTYVGIVNAGRGNGRDRDVLRRVAHTLIERDSVDAIVLAGTELALVFDGANTDFPVVDCAAVHIDGIVRRMSDLAAESR
jgi:aspartate racemase